MCDFTTSRPALLKEHLLTHDKDKFKCSLCDFSTPHEENVRLHKLIRHPESNPDIKQESFQCDLCELTAESPDVLKKHIDREHLGLKFR